MSDLAAVIATLGNMNKKQLATKVVDLFKKNMQYLTQFEQVSHCYALLGHYDKAIKVMEIALPLAPNPQASYLYRTQLANLYIKIGKINRALIYIEANEKIHKSKEISYLRLLAEEQKDLYSGISKTGYWDKELAKKHHIYSKNLSSWLSSYFEKDKMLYDFGCGVGSYLKDLKDSGFKSLVGYEGSVPDNKVFDNIQAHDLTKPLNLEKKGNVLFLEVGEHIPAEYQDIVLDNVCDSCDGKLVLSWAVRGQGGTGHINELDNHEIIPEITRRGFIHDDEKTKEVRKLFFNDPCPWFLGSIMIFERKA